MASVEPQRRWNLPSRQPTPAADGVVYPESDGKPMAETDRHRDEMMAHFAADHPDKTPYRAILRIELFEPGGRRLPAYRGGKSMEVLLVDPQASESLQASVTLNYATHFTGFFILMMSRFAASL